MWFVRGCRKSGAPAKPRDAPQTLRFAPAPAESFFDMSPRMPPGKDWGAPIRAAHPAGEARAAEALSAFAARGYGRYERDRSRADVSGATSRLSHHLVRGELSPRDVYWAAAAAAGESKTFDRRIHWRDLASFSGAERFPRRAPRTHTT